MNRIERLAAILLLLKERARTAEEIAGVFEVSRRTVLRDVQALSEMGVPVIAREGPGGGYSLPQEYRAEPLPLTADEAFLLLLSLHAMQEFSDLPFREAFASLQAKLRAQLPRQELSSAEGLMAAVREIAPDDREHHTRRAPFLDQLLQAAREERWLKVTYQSSARISTQYLLPRQVYTQEGWWYVRAYTEEHRQERTYRVDRVQAIELPGNDFQPQPILEGLPYTHESHPHVQVRLTSRGAAQIEVDKFLARLFVRREDGSVDIDFHCPPYELDYFARIFAGFPEDADVLAPPELRQKLKAFGEKLAQRYKW